MKGESLKRKTPIAINRVTNCCICGEKRKQTAAIHRIVRSTCRNTNGKKHHTQPNSNGVTSSKYMRRKIAVVI